MICMAGKWIDERELQRLEKAKTCPELSQEQRDAIAKIDQVLVMKSARTATRVKFAQKGNKLGLFLKKPFEQATREDLARYLAFLAQRYSPEALRHLKSCLRRFYTLLLSPYEEKVPSVVRWIKTTRPRASHQLPREVFTRDEIKRMLNAARTTRDRTVIAVLYESGTRVSEMCGLAVGDVEFDQYGARIIVDGKTGVRRVRLIQSVPDLRDLLNSHPWKHDPAAPLFMESWYSTTPLPLMQESIRRI